LPQVTRTTTPPCWAKHTPGILFHPPQKVIDEFPQFPVTLNYSELRAEIDRASARI
jgi:phosphoserine/homoserine phosphotransferase